MTDRRIHVPEDLAVLPVRDTVLFPQAVLPLTVGRESSVALINSLASEEKVIAIVAQRDPRVEAPGPTDLFSTGTAAMVHKVIRMPNNNLFIFVEGFERVRIREFLQFEPFIRARMEKLADVPPGESAAPFEALVRNVQQLFQEVVSLTPQLSDDLQTVVLNMDDPGLLADFVASTLPSLSTTLRQELLETLEVKTRLERLHRELSKEVEVLQLRSKLQSQVQDQVNQNQREYFLREQMKAIQKELGELDDTQREMEELRQKIEEAGMPEEVKKEAQRELKRLEKMSPAAAEYMVARTYLDWLVAVPWSKSTGSADIDVANARLVLDEDHYDLEKVKERILDYLAVKKLQPAMKGPILCFVGPPGVGKTSLGKSIAQALGRKFVRISLGGIHDEAEIRGHRRTYIGALPGQIIQGLRRAESNDPVYMLDEVDKLGRDFRGDPASALLEVLDPEQNFRFHDHYLDIPFDLSKVFFITTANYTDPIPEPLRDRMELIELPGYTEEEKVHIAQKYLVPKQAKEHGLQDGRAIRFTDEAISEIIRSFTREAGVRNLEREIATVCRKQARAIVEGKPVVGDHPELAEDQSKLKHDGEGVLHVTPAVVRALLGVPRFRLDTEVEERVQRPGVVVGVAWTPAGGDILFVEANRMPGSKQFTVTGSVGEVMQESMQAALTWVRSNAESLGIDPNFFKESDLHIHVPAGAVPKDGPSAGLTMVTALVSLLANRKVRPRVAMTGEITLSGQVLPVGGIKEKVLAARRAGIKEVILPKDNEPNVRQDLPAHLLEGLNLHFVKSIAEALETILGKFEPVAAGAQPRPSETKPPVPLPAQPVH